MPRQRRRGQLQHALRPDALAHSRADRRMLIALLAHGGGRDAGSHRSEATGGGDVCGPRLRE